MRPVYHLRLFLAATVLWIFAGSHFVAAQSPAGNRAEHRSLQHDIRIRGIEILDSPYRTPRLVHSNVAQVLDEYRLFTAALVEGNLDAADRAAAAMLKTMRNVPMGSQRDAASRAWRQQAYLYERVLKQLQNEETIPAKRSSFADLSEIVYCTVKNFDLGYELSNVFFCPMALDGKGAFWLTESEKVDNPYLRSAMTGCGELRETLGAYANFVY